MSEGTSLPMILIIEDDASIAAGLALNLKIEGFASEIAVDGILGLEAVRTRRPRLIILDLGLPRLNGLEVLAALRAEGDTTPVIVLSARPGETDKVAALKLGADDYVTKPFSLAELMARVLAVLRRVQEPAVAPATGPGAGAVGEQLTVGELVINKTTRTLLRAGREVKLTHIEFNLLAFLAQHPGRVFTRERLLRDVWDVQHDGSARTVDNFVAQLRAKIEDDPEHPRHLVTVRGSGYRLDP